MYYALIIPICFTLLFVSFVFAVKSEDRHGWRNAFLTASVVVGGMVAGFLKC